MLQSKFMSMISQMMNGFHASWALCTFLIPVAEVCPRGLIHIGGEYWRETSFISTVMKRQKIPGCQFVFYGLSSWPSWRSTPWGSFPPILNLKYSLMYKCVFNTSKLIQCYQNIKFVCFIVWARPLITTFINFLFHLLLHKNHSENVKAILPLWR